MRITEGRIRQIIREEAHRLMNEGMAQEEEQADLEIDDGPEPYGSTEDILRDIKKICDTALMNKSLGMRGPPSKVMQSIVDKLNEMMGEKKATLAIARYRVKPPHRDAIEAFKKISVICSTAREFGHLAHPAGRVELIRAISEILSEIRPYKVEVEGLPKPHPGGRMGADLS